MTQWPEHDWSYNENPDAEPLGGAPYDEYGGTIGGTAYDLLLALHEERPAAEIPDCHGWTENDSGTLVHAYDIDWLDRLLVPPESTSGLNRLKYSELMDTWRAALPFAEAERNWLWRRTDTNEDGPWFGTDAWTETVRQSEVHIVSAGISRVVYGRDLLQRWWAWRRETGDYAGQGSLDQAKAALGGLVALLKPGFSMPPELRNAALIDIPIGPPALKHES